VRITSSMDAISLPFKRSIQARCPRVFDLTNRVNDDEGWNDR
jgi:hypothetical protein